MPMKMIYSIGMLNALKHCVKQHLPIPNLIFHRYAELTDEEADQVATNIWNTINKINLDMNIAPTKNRANIILEKDTDHSISSVKLRKI